jgi:hypothetical protein
VGKQTAAAMTDADERDFLGFLRTSGDIQLLEAFAPSPQEIAVSEFAPREGDHWQYLLWNREFPCDFRYGRVTGDKSGRRQGWYYLHDTAQSPFIEYDRHNFLDAGGVTYGRIYWAKCRTSTGTFTYDVERFRPWYERVVRWIRKNGRQRERGPYNVYYLPDAWEKHGAPR